MGKVCKKCGYERLSTDSAPDYECPKCGAVYAKVEALLQRQAEDWTKRTPEDEKQLELEAARARARAEPVVTKTYTGSQEQANALFQSDAAKMATIGYFPTSQAWAPVMRIPK